MIDFLGAWRRRRAAHGIRIEPEQWARVEAPLTCLRHLNPAERERLRDMAREFVAAKEWSGARGVEIHADMQLGIALQACLLVLKLGLDWYRGWVGIVVYPGDFVIPRQIMDEAGVVHEYDDEVLGEAWEGGPVLVSWNGGRPADGINVVIHEFAHKLDMTNGAADGLPALHAEISRAAWSAAFEAAYEDFSRRAEQGDTALDPYAAEHPAEFFAVMTEAFFETPDVLSEEYPQVYEQLRLFYRQDPAGVAANRT